MRPAQQRLDEAHGTGKANAEAWLIWRLGQLGERIEEGATDYAIRAERVRKVILHARLEAAIAGGTRKGKPETFAQVFERVYGEPLITEAMSAAAKKLRSGAP